MQKVFKYFVRGKEVSKEEYQNCKPNGYSCFLGNEIHLSDLAEGLFHHNTTLKNDISYNVTSDLNKVRGCPKGGLQCFCDGSCHEKKPLDFEINSKELPKVAPADLSKMLSRSINALTGVKESQEVKKAPIFTYCKVNRNAIEALSLRALHGHEKYEKGDDWENFSRVPNGDFEYSNSLFRHALGIGEEDEETHLIAGAWNAVARLEIYLRNKVK